MNYTITCYSTALFSTWFFIEELGLLFDAGDGLTSKLLQKSRKIKEVFITHADRDHITGLTQFNQLNARAGYPKIFYPKDCGSFPALESFLEKFDPHVKGTQWLPIKEQMTFKIKGNIYVESIRNGHVPAKKELAKSLSYKVVNKKRKIKQEFANLSGKEIAKIAKEKGKDFLTNEIREVLIGYSGDTPIEEYERWDQTKILIHEATFLNKEVGLNTHTNKHSTLEEVMKMVSTIKIEKLILSHFSSRYSKEEIDNSIREQIKKYNIKVPVYRILPGRSYNNILEEDYLN